jgi:hypothetical protein
MNECTTWTNCAVGSFQTGNNPSATANRNCDICASGTYSVSLNAIGCTAWQDCDPGTSVDTGGTTSKDRTCIDCAYGAYSSNPNMNECTVWSTCATGTFQIGNNPSATEDRSCLPLRTCDRGTYQDNEISMYWDRVCEACPPETYTSEPNMNECTAWTSCAAGSYPVNIPNALSDRVCVLCPTGTFNDLPGATTNTCQTCLAGQYSGQGASACTPCLVGEYSERKAHTCTPCEAGNACVPKQNCS